MRTYIHTHIYIYVYKYTCTLTYEHGQVYHEQKKKLEKMAKKQQTDQEDLELMDREIDEIKGKWEKELQTVVGIVGRKFSEYFADIGCEGKVKLNRYKDPESGEFDYDKWGLEIHVKYRSSEPMKLLSGEHTASGIYEYINV